MRKLFLEEARSWVLLLPLAIRIRHDTIDPELGFSPYQLVFGRDRPGFGLPWALPRENLEARGWFERREQEERELGDKLRKRITDQLRRLSSGRKVRSFQKGDRVWMKRPKGVAGPGLQPVWLGPYVISRQVGEHSFEILVGKEMVAVHNSQLKICVEVGLGEEVLDYGPVVRPLLAVEGRDSRIGQCNSEARGVAQFSPRRPAGFAYVDPTASNEVLFPAPHPAEAPNPLNSEAARTE